MTNPQCMVPAYWEKACHVKPGGCSDDVVTIWHGLDTPAVACGFHARYYQAEVFRAHRWTLAHDVSK